MKFQTTKLNSKIGKLAERAMLVSLTISGIPGNDRVDQNLTEKIKAEHKMGSKSGNWNAHQFPPDVYAAMASIVAACRAWNRKATNVWPENGWQMIGSKYHPSYMAQVRRWKEQVEAAWESFIAKLPEMRAWAKQEHNGAYDESRYVESRLRSRFCFDVKFRPVPASSQYCEALAHLLGADAESVNEYAEEAMKNAQADLWARLHEPLANLISILNKSISGKETRITKTLVSNVEEIADLVPMLNIDDDPELNRMADAAKKLCKGITAEKLSESEELKRKTLAAARDLAEDFKAAALDAAKPEQKQQAVGEDEAKKRLAEARKMAAMGAF